ncbi:hypothetical protein [Cupriavidus basilensis]|nr:hypothetical protein [Cupriavidus basilensis]
MRAVNAVHMAGALEVYVRRGPRPSLTVAAEYEEDLPRVKTSFSGDILKVYGEARASGSVATSSTTPVILW